MLLDRIRLSGSVTRNSIPRDSAKSTIWLRPSASKFSAVSKSSSNIFFGKEREIGRLVSNGIAVKPMPGAPRWNKMPCVPCNSRAGIVNLTIRDRVGAGYWPDHAATEAHVHASNELARRSL